jgi:hypothetical protein
MRVHLISWVLMMLVASTLVGFVGCGQSDPSNPPVNATWPDPLSERDDCCGVTYDVEVDGISPAGGNYYLLALTDADTIVLRGVPVWIPEGPFTDTLALQTSQLDGLPGGEYVMQVYGMDSIDDRIEAKDRRTAAVVGTVNLSDSRDPVCAICCTRDAGDGTGRQSRRYCFAAEDVGDVVELRSKIKTRWGMLCGGGTAVERAKSAAFINIQNTFGSGAPSAFVQAGYGQLRSQGTTVVHRFFYMEVKHPTWGSQVQLVIDESSPVFQFPSEGEYKRYRVVLDQSQPAWHLYYGSSANEDTVGYITVPSWQTSLGRWIMCETEIEKRETDMPGTAYDPCRFVDCYYRGSSGTEQIFDFAYADYMQCSNTAGNPVEWMVDWLSDTLVIWDVNPLQP